MKRPHLIWIIPLLLIFSIFLIRLVLPREIDDLHPNIPCEQEYIDKSDILWIIPNFHGTPLNNQTWCKQILSLNKTLGLHGINHTYKEFQKKNISENELNEAINLFKDCFGYAPTMFKPPQLHMNSHNREVIEKKLEIKYWFNQITHRVYHCDNDTTTNEFGGILPNKFYDYL